MPLKGGPEALLEGRKWAVQGREESRYLGLEPGNHRRAATAATWRRYPELAVGNLPCLSQHIQRSLLSLALSTRLLMSTCWRTRGGHSHKEKPAEKWLTIVSRKKTHKALWEQMREPWSHRMMGGDDTYLSLGFRSGLSASSCPPRQAGSCPLLSLWTCYCPVWKASPQTSILSLLPFLSGLLLNAIS